MPEHPAGPLLADLGVNLHLEDNQHLTDAVVIGRVVDFEDGKTALVIGVSAGVDWVLKRGLIEAARDVLNHESFLDEDD